MYSTKKILLLVFIEFIFINSFAQFVEYKNIKTYTLEQGLSSVNVRNVVEDKYGFLWFSTQDGLNKYDGKKFTVLNTGNSKATKSLLGNDCFASSYLTNDDYIYILNGHEGLNKININTNSVDFKIDCKTLIQRDTSVWLKRMIRYENYLIISAGNRIIYFNTKTNKTDINFEIDDVSEIDQLFVYKDMLYVILPNWKIKVYKKFAKNIENTFINSILSKAEISNNAELFNDKIYFSTTEGLRVFDLKLNTYIKPTQVFENLPNSILSSSINSLHITKELFFLSTFNGVVKCDIQNKTYVYLKDNNIIETEKYLTTANHIFEQKNSIWISGVYGIAQVLIPPPHFESVFKSKDSKTKLSHIYGIKKYGDELQVSAEDGGYKVALDNNLEITKINNSGVVLSSLKINDRNIFSTNNGLKIESNGSYLPIGNIYYELKPIENDWMIFMEPLSENSFLLGSQNRNGLYLWNKADKTLENFNTKSNPKLADIFVNKALIFNPKTAIIVSETSIYKFEIDKKSITEVFSKQNLGFDNAGVFMDIYKLNSHYYIACYGLGIVVLDSNFKLQKIINRQSGVNNLGLYKVFGFGVSKIVATSNNGLIFYNTKTNTVSNYFKQDGLHSNAFEESSGLQDGETFYLGGIDGLTIFKSNKMVNSSARPIIYFEKISFIDKEKMFDTTNINFSRFSIPNNVTQTKINFIAIDFQNSDKVKYYYRIIELNENWIYNLNQNFIDLIGLAPGTYHLQIKASNEDGEESEAKEMIINFLPKWYQTLLFKILIGLLIATLLYILYSFRVKQLKKIIAVRQKISQNLHDDIGSTLSAINMYTQVAKLQPQQNDFLNSIESNTQDVLNKLDDIIWSTNPKNDKFSNLADRMEILAFPLCKANGVQFVLHNNHDFEQFKIAEATRQNVYLVFKEALNNALKYAQCKKIEVALSIKNKNLLCFITDDGKGFDTLLPSERNGLLNMQIRAKELKGSCTVSSIIGTGTTVAIQIPL